MPENYVLLERTELNDTTASVTFANIPQSGYTDLKIVTSLRGTVNLGSGYVDGILTFNGTTTGYSERMVYGLGGSAGSVSQSSTGIKWGNWANDTSTTANTFGNCETYIPNYTSSNYKSVSVDGVQENNASGSAIAALNAGLWSNTAAITSITLTAGSGSFAQYSTFSLYGIAAVGTTPAIAPKAYGGNVIDYDGTYWIHTFTSSGTFTPQTGLSCDVLVVAGGGGGASTSGGGGAAGGYRTASSFSATTTSFSVTIGAGGTGAAVASSGSDSIFSTITSTGGGYGGAANNNTFAVGASGGSGGGGGSLTTTSTSAGGAGNTPSTSPSQGSNGGSGSYVVGTTISGGGGGGAGGAGGNSIASVCGTAGAGVANSISGTSVTYATGGRGGGDNAATPSTNISNTGNGGYGGFWNGSSYVASASGNSGIVIIKYPA